MPPKCSPLFLLVFSFFVSTGVYAQTTPDRGAVQGTVRESVTGETLIGVHVRLVDTDRGSVTDVNGRFAIRNVPAGAYTLEARMLGFAPAFVNVTVPQGGGAIETPVMLNEEAVALDEIVVKPAEEALSVADVQGVHRLSGEALDRVNLPDQDIYRSIARMAGLTTSDFSSRFSIRGGEHDEVLVTLDGLELFDPFHLKDIGGGMSVIEGSMIESIDLYTGAFPAEFGDKLSGVLNMTSATPGTGEIQSLAGASLMNARAFSQGTFKNRNTSWMLVGRRGYLDMLLDLTGSDFNFTPKYYDGFGKIVHRVRPGHVVMLEGLVSGDRLKYQEPLDPKDRVNTRYGNAYLWTNWKATWNASLYSHTVASYGTVWQNRNGIDLRPDDSVRFRALDDRSYKVLQLKQDWTHEASPAHLMKWGVNFKHFSADYAYASEKLQQSIPDPSRPRYVVNTYKTVDTDLQPRGAQFNLYMSHQVKAGERLVAETGVRYGYASWTGDGFVDPRVNLAFRLNSGALIRAGWGQFHQQQGIEQLGVQDGETQFSEAQRARHIVLGYEHRPTKNTMLRLDLYAKRLYDLRPRFVSLAGDAASIFPELDDSRALIEPEWGRSRGVELQLGKDRGGRFHWWGSYVLSGAEDRIDGAMTPRAHDQRHSIRLETSYRPTPQWDLTVSWQYRTGWRYSDVQFEALLQRKDDALFRAHYGPLYTQRYPAYHRMDVRISRNFDFKAHRIAAFLEVGNVYNRKNVRMYLYGPERIPDQLITMKATTQYWLPVLPAFGVRWELFRGE